MVMVNVVTIAASLRGSVVQADRLGPKVGGHPGLVLHSSEEPGELSWWQCHDDSTINIFRFSFTVTVTITIRISGSGGGGCNGMSELVLSPMVQIVTRASSAKHLQRQRTQHVVVQHSTAVVSIMRLVLTVKLALYTAVPLALHAARPPDNPLPPFRN